MQDPPKPPGGPRHPRSTAFLLAQIGAHAASRFAERLSQIDLVPAHAGILRTIASDSGISQQALAALLGMLPSRLVTYIDELEERGLVARRNNADDRRVYALELTDRGKRSLAEIGRISRAHDDGTCAALGQEEREQLGSLLRRIADEQGLTPGVHPGFARAAARPRLADQPVRLHPHKNGRRRGSSEPSEPRIRSPRHRVF